jgi:hypothetical protein
MCQRERNQMKSAAVNHECNQKGACLWADVPLHRRAADTHGPTDSLPVGETPCRPNSCDLFYHLYQLTTPTGSWSSVRFECLSIVGGAASRMMIYRGTSTRRPRPLLTKGV